MKLSDAIERYIVSHRAIGYAYKNVEETLIQFLKRTGDVNLIEIKAEHVLSFLNRTPISVLTWRGRHGIIRRFIEYYSARDEMPTTTMPPSKGRPRQEFVPYIFTKTEIKSLLTATQRNSKGNFSVDHPTFRTIILTMYATGLPVGEISTIMALDVDVTGGLLRIRSPLAHRDRCIPIGPDLCMVLDAYLNRPDRCMCNSGHLFSTRSGQQITAACISRCFVGLRRDSKVHRRDDSKFQPRVSDLRFTFAVHRISEGIEKGRDLNRLLPALAAYMGQSGLGTTARYLALTPERFRKNLNKLSSAGDGGHWKNDPDLMKFLDEL